MKLRTPLSPRQSTEKITLRDPILTIGSCFSDSIGDKLIEYKFDTLVNPFGTIFDPFSITRLLGYSLNNQSVDEKTYVSSEGVLKNLELHSSFTGLSRDELSLKINARLTMTHEFLKSAKWLIVTLGTAHVYQYIKTSSYIANCQKLPAENFTKELIPVERLKDDFTDFLNNLLNLNPDIHLILTVSPVRHLNDGIPENAVSKSILRLLCHQLSVESKVIHYYPAFELMMDDLRDYRFYAEDMVHPSTQAIDYIWNHFCNSFMDKNTLDFIKAWEKISKSLAHRPYNPATAEHQQFLKGVLNELKTIEKTVAVEKEIARIKEQLLPINK
jgi:GSCFA family